jgi:hypothetical protein
MGSDMPLASDRFVGHWLRVVRYIGQFGSSTMLDLVTHTEFIFETSVIFLQLPRLIAREHPINSIKQRLY